MEAQFMRGHFSTSAFFPFGSSFVSQDEHRAPFQPLVAQPDPVAPHTSALAPQVTRSAPATAKMHGTTGQVAKGARLKSKAIPEKNVIILPGGFPQELQLMIIKEACEDTEPLSFAYSHRQKKSYSFLRRNKPSTKPRKRHLTPVSALEVPGIRDDFLKSGYFSNINFDDTTAAADRLERLVVVLQHPIPENSSVEPMIEHIKEITITKNYFKTSSSTFFEALAKLPDRITINIKPSAWTNPDGKKCQANRWALTGDFTDEVCKLIPENFHEDPADLDLAIAKLRARVRFDEQAIQLLQPSKDYWGTDQSLAKNLDYLWSRVKRHKGFLDQENHQKKMQLRQ